MAHRFNIWGNCADVREPHGNAIQSDGDTDVMIVMEVIKLAAEKAITVFSDDTDVLVLLMYYWSPFICGIYVRTERVTEYSIGSRMPVSS